MTEYLVAMTDDNYARCHRFLKKEGMDQDELDFPTIMAINKGVITGVLCTHISNGLIVAGPVAIKSDRPHYWTFIRLIETYENVMRAAGVTAYVFSVPDDEKRYLELIDKIGMKPYAEENGHKFFDRKI